MQFGCGFAKPGTAHIPTPAWMVSLSGKAVGAEASISRRRAMSYSECPYQAEHAANYWNYRYKNGNTDWNVDYVHP
ncbi:hypothetical protein ElyMa_005774500 [Elysia marginata]|uniref:Uncharacterized protein n=1 Tax=Elysia marginata TaxID=1093978 RepID=A0AAV4FQP8_9GAST|nr:hypothetical protein ElyMa_005774500 [Elysia marginata]